MKKSLPSPLYARTAPQPRSIMEIKRTATGSTRGWVLAGIISSTVNGDLLVDQGRSHAVVYAETKNEARRGTRSCLVLCGEPMARYSVIKLRLAVCAGP